MGICDKINQVRNEPGRPSERESGSGNNWCPFAEIAPFKMKTRGEYPKGYPEGAVIHYTSGRDSTEKEAYNTLKYGKEQGHAYFLIGPTGIIYQAHALNRWGYHAGDSFYPGLGESVSKKLVGIEIACAGMVDKFGSRYKSWFGVVYEPEDVRYSVGIDNIVDGYYKKYTLAQEDSLIKLLNWLKNNNPKVFNYKYVIGHDEASPGRKQDPGASHSLTMPELRDKLNREHINT